MCSLKFSTPQAKKPGTIASILRSSYAPLVSSDTKLWSSEIQEWKRFDMDIYGNPDTIGQCTFLSWWGKKVVGFGSFDPRQMPDLGIIGHNCILPEFRGRGFGKQQIAEILRRFRTMGIKLTKVVTLDHPFFAPARAMYISCGFKEEKHYPWETDRRYSYIEYLQHLG
jgi:GNAT superfamily N-acetyltransferase